MELTELVGVIEIDGNENDDDELQSSRHPLVPTAALAMGQWVHHDGGVL